jgi:hypothetical protein
MWTLIKGAFWFSLVLVALPLFNPESSERLENGPMMMSHLYANVDRKFAKLERTHWAFLAPKLKKVLVSLITSLIINLAMTSSLAAI